MLLLLKVNCHLRTETFSAAAQKYNFKDIVTPDVTKFPTLNKHISERRKSKLHSGYAALGLFIMMQMQDNPR